MTNSFKPTPVKCVNRLSHVRITPISATSDISKTGEEKSLRGVPFVDAYSQEVLCLFRTKLFQGSNNTSMPNSLSKQTDAVSAQQSDLKRNSLASSYSKFSLVSTNVPILNPIYFCIFNPCQEFTQKFGEFFKSF